jgi:sigma-B regulation protein RsbU (phosphoserine phosphatase)
MKTQNDAVRPRSAILEKSESVRMYSSSALHAAKYFHFVRAGAKLLDLADELQGGLALPALAVVDEGGAVLGIIRRERLLTLLGKPFGRDVLRRSLVAELVEEVPVFDAHADLFAVAELMLPSMSSRPSADAAQGGDFCVLLGERGAFLALLASQDLANYLSRMTQEDIELAARLQERLLAGEGLAGESKDEGGAWRIEAWSRPAKGVGGDFYFSKRLDDGKLFLTLCDVSGKGVAASIIVSMLWGMLRMFDFGLGLRKLVLGLNESIVATFHMEKYLTGVFLVYDPARRRLIFADMGHSHTAILRGGKARTLNGPHGNLPIGVDLELNPAIYSLTVESGDRLLLYSDGLIEQEDSRAAEFGDRRLLAVAAAAIARGDRLREKLPEALDAHRGGTPQQDDMSFLLLSIDEGARMGENREDVADRADPEGHRL